MSLSVHFRLPLLWLWLALPALAQLPAPAPLPAPTPVAPLPASLQVVNGYLVVHLPSEGVTVVGQPVNAGAVDLGWATWAQRGQLLWRGEMTDSQGRLYNVRILPGYVAPAEFAQKGWKDAGHDLAEYGKAGTWTTMGHHMRDTFKWGWKTSLWEFGLKGTKEAWGDNFDKAHSRTSRKTFGWPLAYPWAFIASAFESALRLPLGVAGAVVGTASAVVLIPVAETTWPALKATMNASVNGVALPVVAWSWQTVAAPPASLFASAPTPSRADGTWMKLMDPKAAPVALAKGPVPEPVLADLTRYATEAATLDADASTSLPELKRLENEEVAAIHAKYAAATRVVQEARAMRLQAWMSEPGNREAMLRLAQSGGDGATLGAAKVVLVERLVAAGFHELFAQAVVMRLADHPLVPGPVPPRAYDKTDPLRGAVDSVKRVEREAGKAGL